MPDLAGFSANEALALVQARGFRAWPRDTFNDHVDQGFVTHTEPRAMTSVQTDVIQIFVAVPSPPPDPPTDPLTDLTPALPEGTATVLKG